MATLFVGIPAPAPRALSAARPSVASAAAPQRAARLGAASSSFQGLSVGRAPSAAAARPSRTRFRPAVFFCQAWGPADKERASPLIIGVGGDSGCGKTTFLRRLYDIFGTEVPEGAHTPVGDLMTVICLDDYHTLDREGRNKAGVTALNPVANNFDLMAEQIAALKRGESVMKPVYNHTHGTLDPPERIDPNHIIVATAHRPNRPAVSPPAPVPLTSYPQVEGLHPMYDPRVRELLDFSIYLDLSDKIKFAWKAQRDIAERGHTLQDVIKAIEQRKPDFKAYVDPQKALADVVLQILPTNLIPNDKEHKVLRVRMIQKEGVPAFEPTYLYDEGSTIMWIPCGRKLTCSYPGIKFWYGPDTFMGNDVSLIEVDGAYENLEELSYVEAHLKNTSTKHHGELTEQLLKNPDFPGSLTGTGLFQVILGMKIRALYEKRSGDNIGGSASQAHGVASARLA
eukprot:tig00020912_g15869.t1